MAREPSSETSAEVTNDKKYEQYLEERRLLIEAELSQSSAFDKYLLVLSSGALALSLTFVREVAPFPKASTYPFLVLAWFTFAFAIGSTLTSLLLSQKALQQQREIYAQAVRDNDWPPTQHTLLSCWVGRLNWLSLGSFVTGAFLLSIFATVNLSW
jgi:hypothetical protein